jgi:SOS-response transcriptional repressor LexA
MSAEFHYDTYTGTVTLLRDHPEWRGVVIAALEEAKTIKGGKFAGAWVLERAKRHGVRWVPNLRKLVAYGILEKEGDSTRGGRRSYYSMRDADGVERALNDVSVVSRAEPYAAHEVTDSGIAQKSTMRVPFFANLASCGGPNMSEAHIDQYIDIDTQLAKPGHQYYLVRADGDSMDLAGINSGDLVLVRVQNHAEAGQKVVASLDSGTTIKELQRIGGFFFLLPRSKNSEHKPIVLTDNAEIQGIVVATIPSFK